MPPKVRELEQQLNKAGFTREEGKGSHRNYLHPRFRGKITISGKAGEDAKPYQVKDVQHAIQETKK